MLSTELSSSLSFQWQYPPVTLLFVRDEKEKVGVRVNYLKLLALLLKSDKLIILVHSSQFLAVFSMSAI
jgi:hypothetical protein